jgi:hypothetical protein
MTIALSRVRDIERAASEYRTALRIKTELKEFVVGDASLRRSKSPNSETFRLTDRGGCGWIGEIGFPDSLATAMTKALHDWAAERLRTAEVQLKALGVDPDA